MRVSRGKKWKRKSEEVEEDSESESLGDGDEEVAEGELTKSSDAPKDLAAQSEDVA